MKEESIFVRIIGKLAAMIFFIALFYLGVSLCLEPICTQTVQNLILNETVSDHLTNVIAQENKVFSENVSITEEQIQKVDEIIQSSPELEDLASEYLKQYAQYMQNGTMNSLPDSQKEQLLESINEDILDAIENEPNSSLTNFNRQIYKTALEEKEQEILDTLDQMPSTLEQTMPDAAQALKTYGKVTSESTQIGLTAVVIITGILLILCRRRQIRWIKSIGSFALIDGLLIAFVVPYIAEVVSGFLTNQLLGRTGDIDTSICSQIGGGMIIAGVLLIIIYVIYQRKRKNT